MKNIVFVRAVTFICMVGSSLGFSIQDTSLSSSSRRDFFQKSVSTATGIAIVGSSFVVLESPVHAAPEIFNTPSGLKYAIIRQPTDLKKAIIPANGDIVAIEYTGYLTDGKIFDATHAEGKNNALTFQLGTNVVIDGLNEIISIMGVGQKVQVIIPPKLAFGSKGLCLETTNECLIKPGSTLVYDVYLKKAAVPPP